MMRHFCTYFDSRYLPRGLALHESMRQHCPEFTLWVLCLDPTAHRILTELAFREIRPISFEEFLEGDEALQAERGNRSVVEFYFTCTPSLPLYILRERPEVEMITYLDADLYFFSSLEPIYEEMGERSIAITPHRYPPELKHNDIYGLYNVGWLSFRRDEIGIACLNWWRDRCLEWCYDREEDGKFADQKYLDHWPALFSSVSVLHHPGVNVAAWNLSGSKICHRNGSITVDGHPLIFYHFHGIHQIGHAMYEMAFKSYRVRPTRVLRCHVLSPYLWRVRELEKRASGRCSWVAEAARIRFLRVGAGSSGPAWRRAVGRIKSCFATIGGVVFGDYFLYLGRRIL